MKSLRTLAIVECVKLGYFTQNRHEAAVPWCYDINPDHEKEYRPTQKWVDLFIFKLYNGHINYDENNKKHGHHERFEDANVVLKDLYPEDFMCYGNLLKENIRQPINSILREEIWEHGECVAFKLHNGQWENYIPNGPIKDDTWACQK